MLAIESIQDEQSYFTLLPQGRVNLKRCALVEESIAIIKM
jgi:hypothetical protein